MPVLPAALRADTLSAPHRNQHVDILPGISSSCNATGTTRSCCSCYLLRITSTNREHPKDLSKRMRQRRRHPLPELFPERPPETDSIELATSLFNKFKGIYCKLQLRPVDEEFCSTQCRDSASGVAPLLIELEPTDPLHKEGENQWHQRRHIYCRFGLVVNTLSDIDWIRTSKWRGLVKRIFKIVMKPTLMEYYYAYRT